MKTLNKIITLTLTGMVTLGIAIGTFYNRSLIAQKSTPTGSVCSQAQVYEDALTKRILNNTELYPMDTIYYGNWDKAPRLMYNLLSEITPPQQYVESHNNLMGLALSIERDTTTKVNELKNLNSCQYYKKFGELPPRFAGEPCSSIDMWSIYLASNDLVIPSMAGALSPVGTLDQSLKDLITQVDQYIGSNCK
jgi:hypothetical protein